MAEVTVLQLAERLSIPLDRLLQQMKDADLPHEGPGDAINDDQQARLLTHLRGVHGEEKPKSKITLKRRESSTLRAGRSTVNVQVRKKRTIVRRPVEEPEPEPVPEPVVEKPSVEEPVAEAKTRETEPATPELEVVAEETPELEEAEPEAPVAEIADEAEAAELPEAEAGEPESDPEAVAEPEPEEVVEPELAAAPELQTAEPEPSAKPKVDLSNIEAIRRAAHAESVAEAERRKEETRRKAAELADKKAGYHLCPLNLREGQQKLLIAAAQNYVFPFKPNQQAFELTPTFKWSYELNGHLFPRAHLVVLGPEQLPVNSR